MTVTPNFEIAERKAGNIARTALKSAYLSQISRTFKRGKTGKLEKSTVTARYRQGRLDRFAIMTPQYSFQEHFGSSKSGNQKSSQRNGADVKSFIRHLSHKRSNVRAHHRDGGTVDGFNKRRRYTAKNHIAKALNNTNALEVLATSLGENRIIMVTSQIRF